MPLDLFRTHALIASIETLTPPTTFLRDRYFPTGSGDIFNTEDVIIEYKDGGRKLAPFVVPRENGILIERGGYNASVFKPLTIAPKRNVTADDLAVRGFGEALYSEMTPQQRQAALVTRDLQELDELITRREEQMCAEVMTTNALTMTEYADDLEKGQEKSIQFYEGANNAIYTPSANWDADGANIMGDLYEMAMMLRERGLAAEDVLIGSDVAAVIISNPTMQTLLDNRRFELGSIKPGDLTGGAALLGVINVYGVQLNLITYPETYDLGDGTMAPYIPANKIIVTAPAAGRTLYGAITQKEDNGDFYTYAKKRVPRVISIPGVDVRELALRSRPLPVVNARNSFITADVLAA